jgi:adenine-specific DNA-methyltransferase
MNFIELESKQKLRGGFYTEPSIASFLVKWVSVSNPSSLLEPSCGDGAFLVAVEEQHIKSLERITACEIDEQEAQKAASRTKLSVRVLNTDFLRWYLVQGQNEEGFDAVVGNPPFIRYQYLPDEQQLLAERIFAQLKLPFTKHTNAWVPFVLASVRMLRPGGRLAMVIPSEIFHIPHAQSLRRYLSEQCAKILVLDPSEIWFNETLQGTVLLLAEKKRDVSESGKGVAVIPITNRQMLSADPEHYFQKATYINGTLIEGKWMPIFLSHNERALISQLKARDDIKRFSDIASVDVGIVTGANKFFLVPDSTVEEFALQQWAHPMFGRSYHVKGIIYSEKDHQINKQSGLPANFLWFPEAQIEELPANARKYLAIGLSQNIHKRYKCRNRPFWYSVPSVYTTQIGMLKRANDYPRLILNRANAYTTDTSYRIKPIGIKQEALVLGFINSLTCLTAEMEGRHYGGGVLELVPSEIERLSIPIIETSYTELEEADLRFRSMNDHSEFLRTQDARILGRIGLTKGEQESLHAAWIRLRDRRHRIPLRGELKISAGDSGQLSLL